MTVEWNIICELTDLNVLGCEGVSRKKTKKVKSNYG